MTNNEHSPTPASPDGRKDTKVGVGPFSPEFIKEFERRTREWIHKMALQWEASLVYGHGIEPVHMPRWTVATCCKQSNWFVEVHDETKQVSIVVCAAGEEGDINDAKFCPMCGKAFEIVPFLKEKQADDDAN